MLALCGTEHIVVAFTGLEGVGKTTLASAVAKDTHEFFSDGVLWGDFKGSSNGIGAVVRSFLVALDRDTTQIMSNEDLIKLLRLALASKRMLLILDNVTGTDFEPSSLLSHSSPSKILLTTANRDLAAVVANTTVDLQPLNEEAARVLLLRIAGEELPAL
ncbi:MAG: NB-ARC domain-containing protein [Anaerolinea sp.]